MDGVMVSVLVSSVVDRGFEPRSGQTKDYKIGIFCFSAKHAALYCVLSNAVCLAEKQNTNFLAFGLTRFGLEPTIYGSQDEHANHVITDAVSFTVTSQRKLCI